MSGYVPGGGPADRPRPAEPDFESASLADIAAGAGLRRVHLIAWRDLDDPEAGGSELHAAEVASRWAQAGLDVSMRTSSFEPRSSMKVRDGYAVIRKSGRYLVFPRTALSSGIGRTGPWDGLVEIWNGMPFFSPLWARCPSIVFLHHVHAEMWKMVLPPALARVGDAIEARIAPRFYRRTPIVTLSESSKAEITEMLRLPAGNITVVPPGIGPGFSPAGPKSERPLVVAVGRLVPVKRFHLLIEALVRVRESVPDLEAVIVGEGYERAELEARIEQAEAGGWLSLPGRVSDAELVSLYRRAWLVASSSAREGWGMTITEAAACGTPAVATDIAGHRDAVEDGTSGLLVDGPRGLAEGMTRVLLDPTTRHKLSEGAVRVASRFTWDATARGTLSVLAAEARRRRA
ncbi:MAG TPA: glycosyltransferase family 4 protein [Acidimicrobiales bacterium]|nr:glycosyltransferase family 4 protein [Acidimicrobiales bacterium]